MATYVNFYTVAFENAQGNPTTRSVMEHFKKVEALGKSSVDLIDREINGNQYRISSYEWPNVGEQFVVIPIGKVKHGAPYVEAADRKSLKELDQRVYDVNVLAYDTTYKTMMITNHQSAPTVNEIENYFNSFLLPDDPIRLRITPIVYNAGLERIQRANRVRNIAIELDLRAGTADLFRQHLDAPTSLIGYFDRVVNGAKDDIMGKTLKLEIGLGQEKRNETLDKVALLDLIAQLNIDSNAIKEIEVRYYGGEKEKIDKARIKRSEMTLRHQFPLSGSKIGAEYLKNHLGEAYAEQFGKFAPRVREYFAEEQPADDNYTFVSQWQGGAIAN